MLLGLGWKVLENETPFLKKQMHKNTDLSSFLEGV